MSEDMGRLQGAAPVIEVSSTPVLPASEIRLKVAVVEKLNLADFQNAVPALHELAIVNETLAPVSELTITITSEPAFLKPRTWSIDTVGTGETFHIADLDVQLDGSLLSRLTEAEPATLLFELRGRRAPEIVIAQHERVVELLARNQWGGIGYAPEMVAAFVQPNDPAVDHVLKAAAQALQGSGKSGSIDGYTHGAKRAWELASGIWTAVLQRKLHYALPPASFEHRGQKVRSPGQILDAGLATCLDLALLFASCLEQANLNPLLIFTHGHAFVGLWLRDEEFSTSVVDDITAVRKRLQLQEMLVFETTLAAQGHPVSFSQAISQGNRQLSEDKDDKFELVVDVKRARMSRIKPLALAQAVADQAQPIQDLEVVITLEDAPDLPDEVVQEVPTAELDPKDRLARWQRKLLDLSLRNALLNFKQGKKALQLDVAAPTLEDAVADGQTLKLLPSPELMQGRDPRSQQLHEARSLEDLRKAHAADALKRREVFIRLEGQELDGRLVDLYRGARNALQEGGANTLFLALGFLVWTRPDKPDHRVKAPLILLPVTLDRKSARSGFSIRAHDDEPRFNPTLVEMLRQDFQLELGVPQGDLPRDDSGLDIAGIWKRVRTAIKDIRGWEVSEDVVLSMFSFAKYLMWKDLAERTEDLRKSPVVAHLIDTPREPYRSTVPFPDARRLDADYTPQQVFCPLPADSSQLSAVMAAARGKDFVLIGPPGTGKSQTIANLIAQCLAEDKRVLFVAEKIAALDVVYRRLREVGLGEFCLELHSNKTRKLDVLAQLQKSWESRSEDAADWATKALQLGRVREQLSTYVERLHHRHRNGLTVYRAIGSVVGGEDVPDLRFSWSSPREHNEAALAALREIAGRLQANAIAVGPHNLSAGPLTPVHLSDWSARWQQEMVRAAQTLGETCDRLIAASHQLCEELGFDAPVLHRNVRSSLGVIAKALQQAAGKDWGFCALPQSPELCAELKLGGGLLSQHRECSAGMSAAWSSERLSQLSQALDLLEQYRRVHGELGVAWSTAVSDELQHGVQQIEEITKQRESLSVKYGSGVAQLNVTLLQREWAKAEKAIWPMSWLGKRKVRSTLETVIEGTNEPRVAEDLAALVRIKSLRDEVGELNPGSVLEGIWSGEKTRTDHARSALKANAALLAARARRPYSLDGLAPAAEGYCGERWVAEVKRLNILQDLDRRIADCAHLAEASDSLWRGHETDVDLLRAALAFEQERLRLKERGALQAGHPAVAEGRCGPRLQQEHAKLQERDALESRLACLNSITAQCPGVWAGLDTEADAITQAQRFHSLLHAGLSGLGLTTTAIDAMRQALHRVLVERVHELNEGAVIGNACQQMLARLAELNAAVTAFSSCAGQPEEVKRAFADLTPDEMADVARQLDSAHAGLHAWCAWRNAQVAARDVGLAALVGVMEEGGIEPARIPAAFEVNYVRWWLAEAVDEDEVLKRFVSAEHERRISEFRALDEEFTKVTQQWIRAKLCAGLPSPENLQRNSEWGVLRREITKKRMHLPLRQLLEEIPSAVLRLTPCLLMSPLSIAQYLSADASSFDIVIFDEASQIPVWDAVGAMARGKQVVMVGDPKQLPPTNFFDRAEASDGDSEDVEGDLESILDECLGASLPTRNLSWHYRSRHESLIAFSNYRYYGGGLVTFPSPVTKDSAVSFHFVEGQYEKGGARINQLEARTLVADLVARLQSPGFRQSGLTIGVVTFNSEQQGLIEDLLDAERRNDPGLEPFFSEVELEPVFVKNLESVQGDERDIMYFSITYGPDMSGAMSMNFGPLNRDGGERRLNVAVTRARHELRVFSSLRGEQMDLSRTKAIGVRDLKHFLEFAECGARALAEAHHGSQGDFDSPFEAAVAVALSRRGWQVHTQIGASSFRIDLGVVHPDLAGRYLAGIECDGATYHRSATARDRDKLREQVLRGLGWEIERIWSTDWWVDPGGTLERVHTRLNDLLAQDRERRALEASAQQAVREAAQTEDEPTPDTAAALEATLAISRASAKPPEAANEAIEAIDARTATVPAAAEFRVTRTDRQFRVSQPEDAVEVGAVSPEQFYEPVYDLVLMPMIKWVVQHEGPVLDAVLARRIARAHGFLRTGSRIQERVEYIARQCVGSTEEATGTFYWPDGVTPGAKVAFRWPFDEDSTRGVDEICEQELLSLARWVVSSGKSGEEALIAMAREIGLMKLRVASRGQLEAALAQALS
ncbi:MAG: helicase related protein [Proteobacteria bacterium]|nr:helicase related protein [Pseudomonadota bacterium]